jgi:putative flavoprotein involved in K+ transport
MDLDLEHGYRPSVDFLRRLGALDPTGAPLHVGGVSTTHVGLVRFGLEFQRSFASNTLPGVSADAAAVAEPPAAWLHDAPAVTGLTTPRVRPLAVVR